MWLFFRWSTEGKTELQPLHSTLIQEELGDVYLYAETWRLIYAIDLGPMYAAFAALSDQINRTNDLIAGGLMRSGTPAATGVSPATGALYALTMEGYYTLKKDLKILEVLFHHTASSPRSERGILNFVGTVHKFLWGTPDNADLQTINHNIANLVNATNEVNRVVKEQTYIMEKTVTSIANNEKEFERRLLKIEDAVSNLLMTLSHDISQEMYVNEIIHRLEIEIRELDYIVRTVMTALELGKRGIILPTLLTPENLARGLEKFEETRGRHPLPGLRDDYQTTIDLSEVSILSRNQQLIYVVKLPVVDEKPWKIVANTPVPTAVNNSYVTFNPTFAERITRTIGTKTMVRRFDRENLRTASNINVAPYEGIGHDAGSYALCESEAAFSSTRDTDDCHVTPFRVTELGVINTQTAQIVIPPRPGKDFPITIHCGMETDTYSISRPSLLRTTDRCEILTTYSRFVLLTSSEEWLRTEISFNISSLNLTLPEGLPIATFSRRIKLDSLDRYSMSLKELRGTLDGHQVKLLVNHSWANLQGIVLPSLQGIASLLLVGGLIAAVWKLGGITWLVGVCCRKTTMRQARAERRLARLQRTNQKFLSRTLKSRNEDVPQSTGGGVESQDPASFELMDIEVPTHGPRARDP